ncbi:hypothetical protein ACFL3G_06945 [Planctomycetota bacterium]
MSAYGGLTGVTKRFLTPLIPDTFNSPMLVRVQAFNALAVSAKVNANQLDDKTIDAIYELVSSRQTPPELNSIAAAAYGALNLPSQKVKDLILDQSKS